MWFNKKINPERIKSENEKKLHSMGIEVNKHLPHLDMPEFRNSHEVASRMMVMLAIFQLNLKAPKEIIKTWIEENGLINELTSDERYFLDTNYEDLPEQKQIDIYWYIEAVWAFAWVGGLHERITFNNQVEDSLVTLVPNIQKNESISEFIAGFKLRSQIQIFEMLDRFYRAHWFTRNNHLTGKKSDKVDLDIIMERRKSLEYVVYKEYEWDEISLDT